MSPNSLTRSPNAAPMAWPACSRTARSPSDSLLSTSLTVSSSSPPPLDGNGTRIPATVSSNSRLQACAPVTDFSCSSRSASSESWCGRNTRRSRRNGRQRASAGSASLASSTASSSRFSSRPKKIRCELIAVTRSEQDWVNWPMAASVPSPLNWSWANDMTRPSISSIRSYSASAAASAAPPSAASRPAWAAAKAAAACSAAWRSAAMRGLPVAGYRSDKSHAGSASAAGGRAARPSGRRSGAGVGCLFISPI